MVSASRNWKAEESTDLVGSTHKLTVTGEVQTHQSNEEVRLTEAKPQGISPATLVLQVSVTTTSRIGAQVMSWRRLDYTRQVTGGQFHDITVQGDVAGKTFKVRRVLS